MPILSELLQYDAAHADTTRAKAEAVERLCGRNALIWPARLIGLEIARAISSIEGGRYPSLDPLSYKAEWFPNIEGAFDDLRGLFQRQLGEILAKAAPLNRAGRRAVQARARRTRLAEITDDVVSELAAMYGLHEDEVRNSIVAVMDERIEPNEGWRRLFSAIGSPTKFVETFFVRHGNEDMPAWLSSIGARLVTGIEGSRASLADVEIDEFGRRTLAQLVAEMVLDIGRSLIRVASEASAEFNFDAVKIDQLLDDPNSLKLIPSWRVLTGYLGRFVTDNLGIEGDRRGHRPERSSAGDIIHALYLPHCAVWRGDRRFAHLLKSEVPEFEGRIATRLSDVPAMITAANLR